MFADFVGVSMDQIFNQMAKFRYMFGGKTRCPAVVRLAMGAGMNMGAQHSQTIYPLLTAVPGLKVVVPSNALRREGPADPGDPRRRPGDVLRAQGAVPAQGRGARRRVHDPLRRGEPAARGSSTSRSWRSAAWSCSRRRRSTRSPKDGIRCDLIDPRTTSPLDEETILESVENTGRLVVVDESNPRCSVAADIAALAASKGFHSLKAPVVQVTAPHSPVPFARELERAYVPGPARIEAAIRAVMK